MSGVPLYAAVCTFCPPHYPQVDTLGSPYKPVNFERKRARAHQLGAPK